jgi:succinate dehydrogenase / fumarate reductase cytochrome b subunit
MSNSPRPLSPHLSIYRPQITTVLSILHRITGVALYFGMALLIVFLWVIGYAPENYTRLHDCLSSVVGQLLLFGWAFSFYFHFFNGIRHLFWDMGKGLEIHAAAKSGWAVVIFSVVLTALSWAMAYHNAGVL